MLLVGVVVAAPYARQRGHLIGEWWSALAVSSLVCLGGFALGLFLPLPGGITLTAGAVGALVIVGLSTPPQPAESA
jgi:hypothetical protein